MLYLTETRFSGAYPSGHVLFVSETDSMDVRFDSNSNGRDIGFTLDARSTSCDYGVKEVRIAAGEVLEDALVSDTDSDGLYPNNAWQKWNIITDENQVNIWFQRKSTYKLFFSMSKHCKLYFAVCFF